RSAHSPTAADGLGENSMGVIPHRRHHSTAVHGHVARRHSASTRAANIEGRRSAGFRALNKLHSTVDNTSSALYDAAGAAGAAYRLSENANRPGALGRNTSQAGNRDLAREASGAAFTTNVHREGSSLTG